MRQAGLMVLAVLSACHGPQMPMADAGGGGGAEDAGTDAGVYEPPTVHADHSLFFNDPALLDDPTLISFKKLMATAAPDGHGGLLLQQWFDRFAQTPAGYERALPEQFVDDFATAHGSDPTRWDLGLMGFKMTGVHNRIDRADYSVGGHCGELRASAASTDLTLQPFHVLFIFRQPALDGDVAADGHVTCAATARKWAELSRLDGAALLDAQRAMIRDGFVADRFELIETVEFSIAPWQWRQWVKVPQTSGPLPFILDNPALFQQVDVEGLNASGPRRDAFLAWVAENAAALDARTLEIPETYRPHTITVPQGVARTPLSLSGLRADVAAQYPALRQNIELMGCGACHTADAEFVQTRTDRTVSPFYDKELKARERHLEMVARERSPYAPYGPLQAMPVLPP